MESRNKVQQRYWFTRGTSFGNPIDQAVLNEDFVDRLDVNINVTSGDRKTVNPQDYYKVVSQRYQGSHYNRIPGLQIDITEHGTQGGSVALDNDYTVYDLSVINEALSKLYEKARGSIDLSVDLYQSRQTIAMASKIIKAVSFVKNHPIDALFKSFEYFKKSQGRFGRTKAGGGLWLEYTYGLKPTLQTIYDTAIELARNVEPLMNVKGEAHSKKTRSFSSISGVGYGVQKCVVNSSTRYRIECKFRSSASAIDLLSRFSSVNPASFIWENLPFSFVADWFYDIGGYMRSLESAYLYGNLFDSGYAVITMKSNTKGEINVASSDSATGNSDGWSLSGWTQISAKSRIKLSGAPFPRAPTFNTDLSSGRLLNAAALLTQFLGKH